MGHVPINYRLRKFSSNLEGLLTPEEKECKGTLWGKHSFRRFNETSSAYLHETYKKVTTP